MRRLRFLVLTEEIISDYARGIIRGIKKFCQDKEIDCVFCNVRHPKYSFGNYEYQFWNGASLINTKQVDIVIVLSGVLASTFSVAELTEILSAFKDKTIISISVNLPIEGSYAVLPDNSAIYHSVFEFLVNKCGSKRIAFFSGNKTGNSESYERFEAYKSELAKFNMEYDDSIVFHGRFIMSSVEEELRERNVEVPDFDAIICANDQMAFGVMNYFRERGVQVPDQLKVVGYDDSDDAKILVPSLSSINCNLSGMGYKAAEIAFDLSEGKKVERVSVIPAEFIARDSTGKECIDSGKHNPHEQILSLMAYNDQDNINMYFLLDLVMTDDSLDSFYNKLSAIMGNVDIDRFAVCFFPEAILTERNNEFKLPEKVCLGCVYENGISRGFFDYEFDPLERILPDDIFSSSSDMYVMQSLFYGDMSYGYILYSPGNRSLGFYNIYMKIFSNALVNSLKFTIQHATEMELEKENKALEISCRTDEMTGVLNRRGFMIHGQHQINYAVEVGMSGIVIFGDMNHLKVINDKFGHDAGDTAIKAEAEILKTTFRLTDSIGRLGGDEFAVVACGLPIRKFDEIKKKIQENCENARRIYGFPFDISISVGAVPFNKDNSDLSELLAQADDSQYIEKRRFHEQEKKNNL